MKILTFAEFWDQVLKSSLNTATEVLIISFAWIRVSRCNKKFTNNYINCLIIYLMNYPVERLKV